MYKCYSCGAVFIAPNEEYTAEGIDNLCPECGRDDLVIVEECERCGELVEVEDDSM